MNIGNIRKADFMQFSTPIQKLNYSLNNNTFYIKREDLIPFSFGGNKARKAFNYFQDIDSGNFDSVVTYGSSSSNHCRVVANLCAQRNMDCFIISPLEASERTFNSRLMEILGAEFFVVPVASVSTIIEEKMVHLKQQGRNPYFIPGGGHGNLGTAAYVDCFNEILKFENENSFQFDYIFFASGTGTTHAGLVCGKLESGANVEIVGISIARKNPRGRNIVVDSVSDYCSDKHLQYDFSVIDNSVIFDDSYVCGGYSESDENVRQFILEFFRTEGIPLDSTYTGKAFYGMSQYIAEHDIIGKKILFIHTGGTPLFFNNISK